MEHMKLSFRNAQLSDIPKIMEIEYASFSSAICESKETFRERINTFPEGFRLMMYENHIIGYISSEIWLKGSYTENYFTLGHSIRDQHDANGNEIYVSSMGILPLYRSKGLGKIMFHEFIKYAAWKFLKVESVILIVSEKWTNARRIYTSQGFKYLHTIDNFFDYTKQKPYYENGIVMRKQLTR